MMRAAVDRSRSTRGGLATSTVVHAALLLLLAVALRNAGKVPEMAEELTKISYVEAHLGEDIEEKVALKTLAKRTPPSIDPGKGISTRSAQKPEPVERTPAPPKTEPRRTRTEMAEVEPDLPEPSAIPTREVETAPKLESRDDDLARRLDVPESRGRSTREAADTSAPELTSRSGPAPDLDRTGGELQSRRATLDVVGGDIDPSTESSRRGGGAIADAGSSAVPGGGELRSRSGGGASYRAPGRSLESSRGARGIAEGTGDAIAPPSRGSSDSGGRRTILDYGSGGGAGGLRSRAGGIAPAPDRAVEPDRAAPAESGIAEAEPKKLDQDGMGMTITGQIAGRDILKVVSPEYSAKARRMGWEGVVAVHFTVLPDGRVKDSTRIQQMSAHSDLNQAALAAIEKFRFAPLDTGEAQVEQWGVITFVFRLK
jgi:TonB family protein